MNIADAINELRPDLQIRDDLVNALQQIIPHRTYFATIPRDIADIIIGLVPRTRVIDLQPIVDRAQKICESFILPGTGKYSLKIIDNDIICMPENNDCYMYVGGRYLHKHTVCYTICSFPGGPPIQPPNKIRSSHGIYLQDEFFAFIKIDGIEINLTPYKVLPCGLTIVSHDCKSYLVDFITGNYERLQDFVTEFINDNGEICTLSASRTESLCKLVCVIPTAQTSVSV